MAFEEVLLEVEELDVVEGRGLDEFVAPLADGNLLGGTTVGAGTGGEVKAEESELYILDMASTLSLASIKAIPRRTSSPASV